MSGPSPIGWHGYPVDRRYQICTRCVMDTSNPAIAFDAKLRKTRNFGNPGAFDYARYLARQDIYWTASTRAGAPIHVLPGNC